MRTGGVEGGEMAEEMLKTAGEGENLHVTNVFKQTHKEE